MLRISDPSQDASKPRLGIHGIWSLTPEKRIPNTWFGDSLPRKFERHTGIRARRVSNLDEVAFATAAIQNAIRQAGVPSLANCRALVLACPALIPQSVARRHLPLDRARNEQTSRVAFRLQERLCTEFKLSANARVVGMNGFCSGYAKAMKWVNHRFGCDSTHQLNGDDYILVVTANRISRITNYECPKSGGLFGDFATVTMMTSCQSEVRPPRFELYDADYRKQSVNRSFFNFEWQPKTRSPLADTPSPEERQLVFSLDGMGIADTAPRAMAEAAKQMAEKNGIAKAQVDWVVPHQAGEGIVRLTSMKLEQYGFTVAPVNGLTEEFGNVSSGSVPLALEHHWDSLHGTILCPVAAVGAPGRPEVSQGCILLEGPPQPSQRCQDTQRTRAA
ncbi:MAG: 3-oxoacyl-[acyl-carrier-protein] synthase III C-terminal domain-containing protein [Pirellulaceae bacterium]